MIADDNGMIVVVYEDRVTDIIGVKLLVLSSQNFWKSALFAVHIPKASSTDMEWFRERANVAILNDNELGTRGWDVKPKLLMKYLDAGFRQVFWVDSDILLTRCVDEHAISKLCGPLVIARERRTEPMPASKPRTLAWKLRFGRELGSSANSCFIRVTADHLPLLKEWSGMLDSQEYRAAQQLHWSIRPYHLLSDQDALTALLGSESFCQIAILWLQDGTDIAQSFQSNGFSAFDRIACIWRGLPNFIHAQGEKPWRNAGLLSVELSIYSAVAKTFSKKLGICEWIEPKSAVARLLDKLTFRHPALRGLPLALIADSRRFIRLIGEATGVSKRRHYTSATSLAND